MVTATETREHSIHSSAREKLLEHLFVGELLKLFWLRNDELMEVCKPEVDNAGYDIILEAHGVIRHVQLKAAFIGAKTARQKIHLALAKKPSGCVVWLYFCEETLELEPYLFFGGAPGEPLPDLSAFSVAKHTKGNAQGIKKERPNIRVVPKGTFTRLESQGELYQTLFGTTK